MTEIIIPEPPITLENAFLLHLMESNADLRLHLECIQEFQKDYIQSKVIKKYNNLKQCALAFFDRDSDAKYDITYYNDRDEVFWTGGEEYQIMISMCIKELSQERIFKIWEKIFPNKNIKTILELWEENEDDSFSFNCHHIVKGVEHDSPHEMEKLELLKQFIYDNEDVINLLKQLSMTEIAKIVPEITRIKYVSV